MLNKQRRTLIAKVPVTEATLLLLREKRIRLGLKEDAARLGTILSCDPLMEIEGYTIIRSGNCLPRRFGAFSYSHSPLPVNSTVGRFCSIASHVTQMGHRHPTDRVTSSPLTYHLNSAAKDYLADHGLPRLSRSDFQVSINDFTIEHDVWVGADVVIAQGVNIGTGAIVATRSVVTKDVPPYAIVAGVPARLVRYRFGETLIRDLLETAWWNYRIEELDQMNLIDPVKFIARFHAAKESGRLSSASYPILYLTDISPENQSL